MLQRAWCGKMESNRQERERESEGKKAIKMTMKADNGNARTQRTELGNNMASGEHAVTEECNA